MRITDDSRRQAYREYIHSPEWAEVRRRRLEVDGWRCTGCGEDGQDGHLEVHHLTYERFGHERLEDLLTLCVYCHAREHGRAVPGGPVAGPTVGEMTDVVRRADWMESRHELLAALADCDRAVTHLWNVGQRRIPPQSAKKLRRSIASAHRMLKAVARIVDEVNVDDG